MKKIRAVLVLLVLFTAFISIQAFAVTPSITRNWPTTVTYTIQAGTSIDFSIEATDSDGDLHAAEWFLGSTSLKWDPWTNPPLVYYHASTWTRQFNTAGTYYVYAYVYDLAGNGPFIYWQITVTAAPVLQVSPTVLSPSCTQGQNASSQSFEVWNSGGGTMSYTIADNATWLSITPTSGSSTSEHDTIQVNYSTSGLSAGSYSGRITVTATGVTGSPKYVDVSLTVNAPPALQVSPATLSPSCTQGQNASSQSFDVWNSGGGTMSYTIADNASWLSVTPTSGSSTSEHDTIQVNYSTSGLSAGSYSGRITVTATGATGSPKYVDASLTVNPPPAALQITPATLSPSCTFGQNASSQSFEVWNSGGGTMSYTIADNAAWLSVTPTSGSSTSEHDTIQVNYTTSTLSSGSYTGRITVTAAGATGSPKYVDVTLNIATVPPTITRNWPNTASYSIEVGNSIEFSIEGSDPEGDLRAAEWFLGSTSMKWDPWTNPPLVYWHASTWTYQFNTVGTYNVFAYVYDLADNGPFISWQITVTPAAALQVSPATLSPSCTFGQNASSQSFEVWNSGGGTMSYTIADNAAWLSVTPTSGSSTSEHDTIQVNYTTSTLSSGSYTGRITVTAAGATGSPKYVDVTLNIATVPPTITRNWPNTASYSIEVGNSIEFSIEGSDPEGDLRAAEWFLGSTSMKWDPWTNPPLVYWHASTWTYHFTVPGTYNIFVYVYDWSDKEAFVHWEITVTGQPTHPGKELFDDFFYSSPTQQEFVSHSWAVQGTEASWGPGVEGSWRPEQVTFIPSPFIEDDRLMRLSATTDGTSSGTKQADVRTTRKYRYGTYAVRARLDATPLGQTHERLVEVPLFLISDYLEASEPYSECDIEYLPNGSTWDGVNRSIPQLFVNTWETSEIHDFDPKVNDSGTDYSGWHTFLILSRETGVEYFVDGRVYASHGPSFAPDTDMHLAFEMWFAYDNEYLGEIGPSRTRSMDIDWLWHGDGTFLATQEVEQLVADFRARDLHWINSYPVRISGTVTLNGEPLTGVVMSGLTGSPVTNALGFYSGTEVGGWSGAVTPTLAGHIFAPISRTYTTVSADQSGQDYVAAPVVVPTITVTSPSGGESWAAGTVHEVTWTQSGLSGTVTIDLYKGGVWQKSLGTPEAIAGTFSWVIASTETAAADYSIRIWQSGGPSDDSGANFTIVRKLKVDFDRDGQEDLLWRCYGTGERQGDNVVWFMGQPGALSPMTLGATQNTTGATSALTGRTAGRVYMTPMDAGNPPAAGLVKTFVTPMDAGNPPAAGRVKTFVTPMDSRIPVTPRQRRLTRAGVDLGDKPSRGSGMHIGKGALGSDPVLMGTEELAAGDFETLALDYSDANLYTVVDTAWEIAGAGDFDGDGNTDLLWRYYEAGVGSGTTIIWYMNGTTVSSQGYPYQVSDSDWRIDRTGDFNGDGKTDILWRYYGGGGGQGTIIIWCMDGANVINQVYPPQVLDTDWKIDGIGDFDGDGRADLLWRYYGTGAGSGTTIIWYMDGINDHRPRPSDPDLGHGLEDRRDRGLRRGRKGRYCLAVLWDRGGLGDGHHLVHGRGNDHGSRPPLPGPGYELEDRESLNPNLTLTSPKKRFNLGARFN